MIGDALKMATWLRDTADELEKAHDVLDWSKVPRGYRDGDEFVAYSLAARINLLAERKKATA